MADTLDDLEVRSLLARFRKIEKKMAFVPQLIPQLISCATAFLISLLATTYINITDIQMSSGGVALIVVLVVIDILLVLGCVWSAFSFAIDFGNVKLPGYKLEEECLVEVLKRINKTEAKVFVEEKNLIKGEAK